MSNGITDLQDSKTEIFAIDALGFDALDINFANKDHLCAGTSINNSPECFLRGVSISSGTVESDQQRDRRRLEIFGDPASGVRTKIIPYLRTRNNDYQNGALLSCSTTSATDFSDLGNLMIGACYYDNTSSCAITGSSGTLTYISDVGNEFMDQFAHKTGVNSTGTGVDLDYLNGVGYGDDMIRGVDFFAYRTEADPLQEVTDQLVLRHDALLDANQNIVARAPDTYVVLMPWVPCQQDRIGNNNTFDLTHPSSVKNNMHEVPVTPLIAPNPFSDQALLTIPSRLNVNEFSYFIFDQFERNVNSNFKLEKISESGVYKISSLNAPSGVYALKVKGVLKLILFSVLKQFHLLFISF